MATKSQILDFIASAYGSGVCVLPKNKTQNLWIARLIDLPAGALPVILEALKTRKKRPKDFVGACWSIYRNLPTLDLQPEQIASYPWGWADVVGWIKRKMVGWGI